LKGTEKVLVKNNQIYNTVNANVRLQTSNVDVRIENNIFTTYDATGVLTNVIVKNNTGYVTENSGTATFSGDGATTAFNIAHGLAATPTYVSLEAQTAGAVGDKHWAAGAANITVTFITAPPTGVNNVVIGWEGKVR